MFGICSVRTMSCIVRGKRVVLPRFVCAKDTALHLPCGSSSQPKKCCQEKRRASAVVADSESKAAATKRTTERHRRFLPVQETKLFLPLQRPPVLLLFGDIVKRSAGKGVSLKGVSPNVSATTGN